MEELTCATSKGGWEDRSDVSCPAYGFRCGIREQSGEEGYSSGNIQLQATKFLHQHCLHKRSPLSHRDSPIVLTEVVPALVLSAEARHRRARRWRWRRGHDYVTIAHEVVERATRWLQA